MQHVERRASHDLGFGALGGFSRSGDIDRRNRIDGAVDLLDALEAALQQLDWRQFLGADQAAGGNG